MFGALKPGFRRLATLKLVVSVAGELQTEKNSCGIARFPCDSTAFLLWQNSIVSIFLSFVVIVVSYLTLVFVILLFLYTNRLFLFNYHILYFILLIARNNISCADVPLRNCPLTHACTHSLSTLYP